MNTATQIIEAHQDVAARNRSSRKTVTNTLIALTLFTGSLLYTLPFVSSYEFLRHTEADRALISWEMIRTGDYLIPRIYGEPYLTKPPLYYWLVAAVFSLTGEVSEATSRVVSGVSLSLLASISFLLLRSLRLSLPFALTSTLMFLSFGHIYDYSLKAEIDICYTLFGALSLLLGYSLIQARGDSLRCLAILTALLLGAAVNVKGPPVLLFYSCGVFGFLYFERRNITGMKRMLFTQAAVVVGALILGSIWWVLVAKQLGIRLVADQFQEELINRFRGISITSGRKPWYYYFVSLPGALLPGSLLLLALISRSIRKQLRHPDREDQQQHQIVRYCCCAIFPTICILTLSGGKSTRYLMPLYPLYAIVLSHIGFLVQKQFHSIRFVHLIFGTAVLLILSRIPITYFVAPRMNSRDSVADIVSSIAQHAVPEDRVYVLEMFERWIPFYLQKSGVTVSRLTPENTARMRALDDGKKLLLLINVEDEKWRISQIAPFEPEIEVVVELHSRKHDWKLLRLRANRAWRFAPKAHIPTRPTTPD